MPVFLAKKRKMTQTGENPASKCSLAADIFGPSSTSQKEQQTCPVVSIDGCFPPLLPLQRLLRPVRLNLWLPVLFVVRFLRQVCGHSGSLHHGLEAAFPLLNVLLRVEDDDIDLGNVEHPQRDGGAQAHGHRQGGGLDEHLEQRQGQQISGELEKNAPCSGSRCNSVGVHWVDLCWIVTWLEHVP